MGNPMPFATRLEQLRLQSGVSRADAHFPIQGNDHTELTTDTHDVFPKINAHLRLQCTGNKLEKIMNMAGTIELIHSPVLEE